MFAKISQDKIIYKDTNSEERRKFLENQLFEFNQAQSKQIVECDRLQTDPPTFIEIYAEIEPEKLIGGLVSYVDWGRWLYIDAIWIDANYRKQGIGQYLIACAEQKAIRKGIKRARLYTFDFQALSFYKKLGYTVYGELEDFPKGHTAYYLKKVLVDS
ncbi:GNAT family N-acetyltransferase [Pleurocapsales cyanobacterium LEGE 10410]|nr:GNAT family N-acetyltransferase [Pleurocapsales cyanobacterium LEGE 10410]